MKNVLMSSQPVVRVLYFLARYRWLIAFIFALGLAFVPVQQTSAYYNGMNSCDQSNANVATEYVTCGIYRQNNGVGPVWSTEMYLYLPANTTGVTMVNSSYDDIGYVDVQSRTGCNGYSGGISFGTNCTLAYQSTIGQGPCGSTYASNQVTVPYTPNSYMIVLLYAQDVCGSQQRADVTFRITHSVASPPTGWLAASNNPCQASAGSDSCTVNLSWGTQNVSNVSLSKSYLGYTDWFYYGNTPTASGVAHIAITSGVTYKLYGNGVLLYSGGSPASVYTYATLARPGGFAVTAQPPTCAVLVTKPTVALTWTASVGASYYSMYQKNLTRNEQYYTFLGTTQGTYSPFITLDNNSRYEFEVKAVNSAGTTIGVPDPVAVVAPNCANNVLSIQISPPKATVLPNSNKANFTVTGVAGGRQVRLGGPGTILEWSMANAAAGSIAQDSTVRTLAHFTASSTTDLYPGAVQVRANYIDSSGTVYETKTATADISIIPSNQITGDVYSGGSATNLNLDPRSVISASNNINVSGTNYKIPGYTTSNTLNWADARQVVQAQADKLIREHVDLTTRVRVLDSGTISGAFNLNPPKSDTFSNTLDINSSAAEGTVWYVPGDLVIGPTTFYGRGTIIVDGNVTITGSITYPADRSTIVTSDRKYSLEAASLGIMLRCGPNNSGCNPKDVTVRSNVTDLVGAFFVPSGTIKFDPSTTGDETPLNASGLFVGNTIDLTRPSLLISYDTLITTLTPPGFGVVSIPTTKETAP